MRTYSSSSSGESPLCWRFTNWRISAGDLDNSVTFESSSDSQETVDSSPISTPLVLKPPAPESGPCEIQLSFSQKYEIRQIYVRSTARVYEIYYSKTEQSGNEYLCTVRCSIAEREGEVLKAFDIGSLAIEGNSEGNSATSEEGNSATSEDDWVEVRAFRSEIQDLYEATAEINDSDSCTSVTIRLLSLQNKGRVCIDEVYIFADPVVSNEPENQSHPLNSGSSLMTLLVPTFLQLSRSRNDQGQSQQASPELKSNQLEAQSKAADSTDNVNGTAKLVENDLISTDLTDNGEGTAKQVESGLISTDLTDNGEVTTKLGDSNLISTDSSNEECELVSRNQIEAKSVATDSADVAVTKHDSEKILPNLTDSGEGKIGQQDVDEVTEQASVSLQDANESTVDPAENLLPHQIPDKDTSSPDNRVEKILEQLLCRVTKIEEVCSRFEESMFKPMKNMETRIRHVEQQLNLLANNSQYSGLPQYRRFSAPSFSCDSNSGSLHDDGCNYQLRDSNDFEKKDFTFSNLKPCDNGMSNPLQSGLPQYTRFSAPSFSCDSGSNVKPCDTDGMSNPLHSGSPHYTRFSAPSFSCDSNSGSNLKPCDNNGMSNPLQSGSPHYTRFSVPSFSCDSNSGSNLKPCDNNGMSNPLQCGSPHYTRFSAPSFSCDFTCSSLFQPCGSDEFEDKDFTISADSNSVNSPYLSPCLVVTVPEFTGEDDQDVDDSKPIHDSPGEKSKRSEDVGELKSPQDCPAQNPKRILIDDFLAASLSGLLSASASHSSKDKQPTDVASDTNKIFLAEDLLTADSSYSQSFTAPEFTFGENCGEEYSDFQFVPLPTSGIELKKDDVCSSVLSNPIKKIEPSNSLADLSTPLSLDSEFVFNECPAALAPVEATVGDKEETPGSAAASSSETVFSFDFFKGGIETIEPLACKNLFPSSGTDVSEVTASSNNGGKSFDDPGVSFNQDAVLSLI